MAKRGLLRDGIATKAASGKQGGGNDLPSRASSARAMTCTAKLGHWDAWTREGKPQTRNG